MDFDMKQLNRLCERLHEKATGCSRLSDGHREMIEKAKYERDEWKKSGVIP